MDKHSVAIMLVKIIDVYVYLVVAYYLNLCNFETVFSVTELYAFRDTLTLGIKLNINHFTI